MRILLVTDGISPFVMGGMQRHSFFVCKWLVKNGINVTLYHCVHEGDELIENKDLIELFSFNNEESTLLSSKCFNFPSAEKLPGHYLRRSRRYSQMLYEHWEAENQPVDFIFCKGFTALAFIKAKKKGRKIPFIGSKLHGLNMYQKAANYKTYFQSKMLQLLSNGVIAHSDVSFSYGGKITTKLLDLGVDKRKILEIPTGIERSWLIDTIPKVKNSVKVFSFVGRYDRVKGLPELYLAIQEVEKDFLGKIIFRFAGPIPEAEQLKSDLVEYVGQISDSNEMKSFLDKTDVLLCPSWSEGMPNVILEAMARSCAIIATDTGAVSELVNSKNGLLLASPEPKGIQAAIVHLANLNQQELETLQVESVHKIRNDFLWEDIAKQLTEKIKTWIMSNP